MRGHNCLSAVNRWCMSRTVRGRRGHFKRDAAPAARRFAPRWVDYSAFGLPLRAAAGNARGRDAKQICQSCRLTLYQRFPREWAMRPRLGLTEMLTFGREVELSLVAGGE
jgi:hypothetical protein